MRSKFAKSIRLRSFLKSGVRDYLIAILVIGATVLFCIPLSNTSSYHVVSFILLFVVTFLASIMGTGAVLMASTLSAIVWNFFFIPPNFTFHIQKTEDILIFCLFFIIALLNGVLTTRVRRQELLAIQREERTNALFELTKELSKAGNLNEVLSVSVKHIETNFKSEAFFVLQDGNKALSHSSRLQLNKILSNDDYHIAEWVFVNGISAGKYTNNSQFNAMTFYPMSGSILSPGVLVVKHEFTVEYDFASFWNTYIALISNALEREFLRELASKARFLDESDKLYKTLFNSISHEFRIPVATIMGAADSLIQSPGEEKMRNELHAEIFTASLRLNRLIENLLNMSRLETGRISPRLNWHDINDLLNKVSSDLKEELKFYNFNVKISKNMPLVKIDFGLIEQAVYNIIYNSLQYSPHGTEIIVNAKYKDSFLEISIEDSGPGFNESSLKNIFDKFYRSDITKTGGLGLGLSIVKGFVEAHNGYVSAENRKIGGAKIKIHIPSENPNINPNFINDD